MKKGINVWSMSAMPVREKVLLAKKAGFAGNELVLDEKGKVSTGTSDGEFAEWIRGFTGNILSITKTATTDRWIKILKSRILSARVQERSVIISFLIPFHS